MIGVNKIKDFDLILFDKLDLTKKNKISIAIDSSGSLIESKTRKALKIIEQIVQDENIELHVWCFDTKVQLDSIRIFTKENVKDLQIYEFQGFGGSELDNSYHYLNQKHYDSDLHIIITDGYLSPYQGISNVNNIVYFITETETEHFHLDNGRCFLINE